MKRANYLKRGFRFLLRLLGAVALAAVLFLLAVLLILFTRGLPDGVVDLIRVNISQAGVPLDFDGVRLSTRGRGWVVQNVSLYAASPDVLEPVLSADELTLHVLPNDWMQWREHGWRIRMRLRDVRFNPPGVTPREMGPGHPLRRIDRIRATVTAGPDGVTLHQGQALWGPVKIDLSGSIAAAEPAPKRRPFPVEQFADWLVFISRRFALDGDASLQIEFSLDPAYPRETEFLMTAAAERLGWEGRVFGPLSCSAYSDGRELVLSRLELARPDVNGQLELEGRIDLASQKTEIHAKSTMPIAEIEPWIPEPVLDLMREHEIRVTGQPLVRATLGPAVPQKLFERIDASVSELELAIGAFEFTPGSLRATLRETMLDVEEIRAEVEGHPLAGAFRIDMASMEWSCDVDAQCNPQFAGLFDEDLYEFISRFSFRDRPPKVDLHVSQRGPEHPLQIVGTIAGERFTWSGVPLEKAEASLLYTNRVLTLDPVRIRRDESRFNGKIRIDFPAKTAWFDAEGTFPPGEVATIIHPDYPTVLDHLEFKGEVHATGRGTIDYGERTGQDFTVQVEGLQVGWGPVQTGSFRVRVDGAGDRLILTNAVASVWGGEARADGWFLWTGNQERSPYRVQATLSDIDFAEMLSRTTGEDSQRARGLLSGTADLSGDAAREFWESAKGRGRVDLRNGHLADLPLFGGFTRIVQQYLPAFRFFSLTSLSADYEVRDSAIHSRNIEMGGTLISATARGSWSPKDGLDFIVRAEPLQLVRDDRSWYELHLWAVDALKTGTAPFFRMLEFRLDGPLANPSWRPVGLPDEVREIFRR